MGVNSEIITLLAICAVFIRRQYKKMFESGCKDNKAKFLYYSSVFTLPDTHSSFLF